MGVSGKASLPAPTPTEVNGALNDFDVTADGSVVATVASTLSGKLLVARFMPNGNVDTSFGTSGYVSVAPPDHGSPQPGAIRIRPSGEIFGRRDLCLQQPSWPTARVRAVHGRGNSIPALARQAFRSRTLAATLLEFPKILAPLMDLP